MYSSKVRLSQEKARILRTTSNLGEQYCEYSKLNGKEIPDQKNRMEECKYNPNDLDTERTVVEKVQSI